MPLLGSSVQTLGPWLVVLFGKVMEPLGSGVLLEEVSLGVVGFSV